MYQTVPVGAGAALDIVTIEIVVLVFVGEQDGYFLLYHFLNYLLKNV